MITFVYFVYFLLFYVYNKLLKERGIDVSDFLPINRQEMEERGWQQPDFVYICGDGYVDHPSFGAAIICRTLESHGFKVCFLAQPDWHNVEEFRQFGKPRLGFLISSGNIDSMVNHYTVAKKRRHKDLYTPGGKGFKRPDRAVIVYSQMARQAYKDANIIIGGIEASLRRLGHYDYWDDKVRKSIIIDANADLLLYGMGENSIIEVAEALDSGLEIKYLTYLDGTVFKTKNLEDAHEPIILPSYEEICKAMKEQAVKNAHNEEQKASIKDVGRQQLRSWGVLIERDGKDYPSNAFAILTGNAGLHVATQCGVFKGTTKAVFVDRREYTGPLWEQIDEAFQFVLRNIHLGATIVGIYRQDVYEIPPDAIRELIINAMVHRSYLDHGTIQVAVYDNRLEITSPGKLPMGQTMERMKESYSKIRNEALAHAFAYMNLIEHWGSGIPRIIDKVKAAGLREPEFIGGEVDLRINIYRGQIDGTVDLNASNTAVKPPGNRRETADKVPANEQEQQIYKYVSENAGITTAQAMKLLGIKQRRTREILVKMVEKGWLRKEGASRSTIYVKNTEGR